MNDAWMLHPRMEMKVQVSIIYFVEVKKEKKTTNFLSTKMIRLVLLEDK